MEGDIRIKMKTKNHSQQPEVITCQGGREMFKSLCVNNDSCLELVSQAQNLPADILKQTIARYKRSGI